jgi:hypothetical protein
MSGSYSYQSTQLATNKNTITSTAMTAALKKILLPESLSD